MQRVEIGVSWRAAGTLGGDAQLRATRREDLGQESLQGSGGRNPGSEGLERAESEEARRVDPAPEKICRPGTRSRVSPRLLSWRSGRRSRTTVRSVVLPNSPTPTAWWPSEDQRTSTGETRGSGPVAAGREGMPGVERSVRVRNPSNQRIHVATVCSRANSPKPFLWCTHPSPAAESSGACVWVRQVGDAEGRVEPRSTM